MGSNESNAKVVLYGDLRCPHCKDFHKNTFPRIKKDYIDKGKISFEYRDLGILGFGSFKLGKLSYVIDKHAPNEYWNYIDAALNINANPDKLISDLNVSKNIRDKIKKDYKEKIIMLQKMEYINVVN
ncbi:DsbA family protein [Staphylococcus shinii]|uniref:DsbA family protein n=1 Tax=Staphylococcus shinii TaxID=2912228 RepID=UPI003511F7F1